jgi:hypothetical protein
MFKTVFMEDSENGGKGEIPPWVGSRSPDGWDQIPR